MTFNWKQYPIRWALICVTIFAVFFAYVSSAINSLAARSRDYDAIFGEHGASVHYVPIEKHRWLHPFLPLRYKTSIDSGCLFETKHDGKTLLTLVPHMNAFDTFRQLSTQNSSITDDDLVALGRLDHRKMLELKGSNFTDASITHIAALKNLEQLDISKTRITVNGLRQLREALPYCSFVADVPVPPVQIEPATQR